MKSYYVGTDESGCIVYAVSNAPARRMGANELDSEWECVECRRAPEWDSLYPRGPTNSDLFSAGWRFECAICRYGTYWDDGGERDGAFYCREHLDPYVWLDRWRPALRPSDADWNPYKWLIPL